MFTLKLLIAIFRHPLNKRGRTKALMRYFRWQICARLIKAPIVIKFVENTRLLTYLGSSAATLNIYFGLAEYEDMSFLLHVLDKTDLFVDIGSNIGAYSILASGVVGANSISIEPVGQAFSNLCENISINSLEKKITPIKICLGNSSGYLFLTNANGPMNHVVTSVTADMKIEKVESRTLDEVLKDAAPFFIKIDVEGYEQKVLDGGFNALKNKSLHIVLIENNGFGMRYGTTFNEVHELLISHGFEPYSFDPKRKLCIYMNEIHQGGNTIYIRNIEFIKERLGRNNKYLICNPMEYI